MILVQNLCHVYPNQKIDFQDFEVKHKQRCLLIGPSGSGKTTLLHLLAGFLKVQKGSLVVANHSLQLLNEKGLDKYRNEFIGYVPQKQPFWFAGTVADQVALPQFFAKKNKDLSLIDFLGLSKFMHQKPSSLSFGQQQRLSLARALANRPQVLLADEPTSALDKENTRLVMNLIDGLQKEIGFTLLVSSHDGRITDFFDINIHFKPL